MVDVLRDPVLLAVVGWFAGWWLWGRPLTVDPTTSTSADAPGTTPFTVVIPARDEASVLPHLLADLAADPDPARRVIVVDDHSTDGTGDLACAHAGIEVVDAPALPPEWTGKNWACTTGVRALADSAGDDHVIAFVDADVRLAPGALRNVVDEVTRTGGVVSVQPFHATEAAYEQLSLFFGIVGLMGISVGRRGRTPDGVFGPVLATSVADYRAVGGHEAVHGEVAEDLALGLRYRAAGLPVIVRLGGRAIRFRMYPAGVGQLIEGWTKNIATGAGSIPLRRSLLSALWITAAGSAVLSLPLVPGDGSVAGPVGVAVYLAFVAQIARIGRATGTFGLVTALCYPVALVAFMAVFVRSTWRLRVRRSVRWRGRTIAVGGTGRA